MPSLDAALKTYETLAALHALPDKAALTTTEAALFLRLSPKTMERMRLDGSGPTYIQGGGVGSRGNNQKCLYLKEDLLSWQTCNRISDAIQAAVRREAAFATLGSLVLEAPFYADANGRVELAAEDASLRLTLGRLGSDAWVLLWLSAIDAASREWVDVIAHRAFCDEILPPLEASRLKIIAALEATALGSAVRGKTF